MLFNSYVFIFAFLPLAFAGFLLLRRMSMPGGALTWLILASIGFYTWWNPVNLAIILPSVAVNYLLGRGIARCGDERPRLAQALLVAGVFANLAFLSYFKYRNFFMEVSNDVFGTRFVFEQLVLPLGISFITFQKIAFLVDVYTGRIAKFSLRDFALFVFFFPQLIAGPIVHYREMMPQFERTFARPVAPDVAVGLGLFACGLFKKVILADGIAQYVSPVFASAAAGEPVSLVYAWIATAGFTLQVYFDFSGYSEMALGAARCFGIVLPVNFNSPLRATSMIDFWKRWHVTLVRFLTAYVFNPVAFSITSRRIHAGKGGMAAERTGFGAFVMVLIVPTMLTMLLSGIWHGAGYGFLVWGLLHGAYLVVNHAWNTYRPRFWPAGLAYDPLMKPLGFVLTFVAVIVAMAFFRAPTIGSGWNVFVGMWGFNGVTLPHAVGGPLAAWLPAGVVLDFKSGREFVAALAWMAVLLAIAWFGPSTLQLFAAHQPALGFEGMALKRGVLPARVVAARAAWRPSRRWAAAVAVVAAVGMLALGQPTEFLYWQF